jgi:hypothetical protein
MFNFSNKDKNKVVITDKIWLTEGNKWQACVQQVKNEKDTIIAVWFDDSFQKIEAFFSSHDLPTNKIITGRELARNYIQNNALIFAEHYPLQFKEQELYEKLGLTKVTVYSSLDEPLFTHFGGDKISNLVKQMGMKEDEAIEHALITSSIKNAQEKINSKVNFDQSAHSQADWFRKNFQNL